MTRGLFAYATSAVWRRRGRAFGLGVGLALTVTLIAAILFVTESLRAEAVRADAALPDVVVQRLVGGRPTIMSVDDAKSLTGIDSVARVRPRIWGYLFVPALQGNVTIVGVPAGFAPLEVAHGSLAKGRDLAQGAHEMVAGTRLARDLGLVVGDELELPSAQPSSPLRLVGTFSGAVEIYTADVLLCDDDDARALLGLRAAEVTDFALDLHNPEEARVVAGTVLERIPGARVIEKKQLLRVYDLAYGRRAGLLLAASIPALVALFLLAWDRGSGLGPHEQKEIAILKAVGFGTRDVLVVKMYESLLVSSLGTAAGLLTAYAWVFWLGAAGLRGALVGWSVLYPESPLTPEVDFAQLLAVATSVVAPYVGLSIVPAWRAAIVDPMESMRG